MHFRRGASRSAAPDDVTPTGASLGLGAVLRLPLPQLDPRPRLFLIGQGRRNRNFAEIGHHGWRVALLAPNKKGAAGAEQKKCAAKSRSHLATHPVASARTPCLTANSKSPAHEPDRERNASCAGRESSTGRLMMLTSVTLGCHACGLRTGAPAAKPLVPSLTRRKLKALTASLLWGAIEEIGLCWGRSQQGRKYRRYCCGNRELTHCCLPQFVEPTLGCINFT